MKVAMYVRVSTQRQALTQTIEQQLQLLREHSQTHERGAAKFYLQICI
jgi:DNA invertase Pin-like site-specific DNA recombinase